MGQSASTTKKIRRKSLRSTSIFKWTKNNLSATFAISEDDHKVEQVNINTATEEDLMTLVGIDRTLAHNIIEHRKVIGRFKKIEDLALAKGVGADKLDRIRSEICVGRTRNQSFLSLRTQSTESLESRTSKLLDINKANVFELQKIPGVTQDIAADIILYRDKKGPFKAICELIKVKNIDRSRCNAICQYLDINCDLKMINNGTINGISSETDSKVVRKYRSATKPFTANGFPPTMVQDMLELFSTYSYRPIIEEHFDYRHNGEQAIRFATWNIEELSLAKAQNPGVKEVICRTILENRWSIVVVQEVEDAEALRIICDELNNPKLRRVLEWKGNSKSWNFCTADSEDIRLGFIYDYQSGGIDIDIISLNVIEEVINCEALLAKFKVGNNNLELLNVRLPNDYDDDIEFQIKQAIENENNVIFITGDFSSAVATLGKNTNGKLHTVLPLSTNTSSCKELQYCDNIFVSRGIKSKLTGLAGVVRQGLTHLAIPQGWSWGGVVSGHCPVWVELYIDFL